MAIILSMDAAHDDGEFPPLTSEQTSQELECQAAAFSACCGHAVASS
jgi:hypothetical protein